MITLEVTVLRLGHRHIRDDRTTTHLFLAARALGTKRVIYSGQKNPRLEDKMRKITENWGGRFRVEHEENWERVVDCWRNCGGEVVHLTMYGLPIQEVISRIRQSPRKKLVIVGGAKVPKAVYMLADWNVAVTSQPHSEISALSIFLLELFKGKQLYEVFRGARFAIKPQAKGKKVIKLDQNTYSEYPE